MAAALEATDLYRPLAATRPEAFAPHLAASLNNLANALSELGAATRRSPRRVRRPTSIANWRPRGPKVQAGSGHVAQQSRRQDVRARASRGGARGGGRGGRSLSRSRRGAPEAFTPNLAVSLNTLSYVLWGLGRRAEALVAAVEAQALSRRSVSGKMTRGSRKSWRASGIFSTNSEAGTELSQGRVLRRARIGTRSPRPRRPRRRSKATLARSFRRSGMRPTNPCLCTTRPSPPVRRVAGCHRCSSRPALLMEAMTPATVPLAVPYRSSKCPLFSSARWRKM